MPCLGECGKICDRWSPEPECRPLCSINKDGKTFVTVRVAGVIPYDAPNGAQPFDLCQGGKCVEAGEFSIFQNGGPARPTDFFSVEVFDDKNAGMSESWIMVTKVAAEEGWNLMKPLTAQMRPGGYLTGLPDPVVIIYPHPRKNKKGKVIYLPEEKRQRYGNLLDRYPEVTDQGPI